MRHFALVFAVTIPYKAAVTKRVSAPLHRERVEGRYYSTGLFMYRVIFYNQNQVFEVYARAIYQSDMYGFIEVEEFVFGERTQLVVDPSEERLKNEFASVKRSYIPLQNIVRIDEVEREGAVKISEVKAGDKVALFPAPIPRPPID